jgi:hypothetical protein
VYAWRPAHRQARCSSARGRGANSVVHTPVQRWLCRVFGHTSHAHKQCCTGRT